MTLTDARRRGQADPLILQNPRRGDFSGRNAETEMEEG